MDANNGKLREKLWATHQSVSSTLRKLLSSEPMVQGSFYLLRRKCGKPNCKCARDKLHATWVLTRSERGKDKIYIVPKEHQVQVGKLAGEYRKYQRARAELVKQHLKLLGLIDRMAEQRLVTWPQKVDGQKVDLQWEKRNQTRKGK